MKDFDWLMLLPMGFMVGWITILITVIIKGMKDEQERNNKASAGAGV